MFSNHSPVLPVLAGVEVIRSSVESERGEFLLLPPAIVSVCPSLSSETIHGTDLYSASSRSRCYLVLCPRQIVHIQVACARRMLAKATCNRQSYFEDMVALPLPTISLIILIVMYLIDEWGNGSTLVALQEWERFSASQAQHLAKELQEKLLRNARATSPVLASQAERPSDNLASSALMVRFLANQG
ncbi:hypothetical protein HGRIS_013056 [Hohenbuehelia grisea]|uniref:ATP synthase protein MI25 n=1 Tax=Hohenbuehelia grisea TaxID=104357 RepID=A0ABR3IUD0_9AGAR